ncbi:MAG: alpha/beta fold hydrolase [Gemmatimonadaceae bacterium]
MTKKEVLFVQGAGAGAHAEDRALVDSLQKALGDGYRVRYPRLPNEGDAAYAALRPVIAKELDAMTGKVILVGHSAGGSLLMKYLSEERVAKEAAGVLLIAAPYFGPGGWDVDDGALSEDFAARLPKRTPLFFYQSRDDEVVPFAHLALYARELPHATVREFDGRGHQFKNDLSEVAADITRLA